jgi:hypothetical protein
MDHASPGVAARRAVWLILYRLLKLVRMERFLFPELGDVQKVGQVAPPHSAAARGGRAQRVLFVAPRYWSTHVLFQVSLAQALTRRGAECALATCGGAQPICEIDWRDKAPVAYCGRCTASALDLAKAAGVVTYTVAEHLDREAVRSVESTLASAPPDSLAEFHWNGAAIGRAAVGAARWKLRTHFVDRHPRGHEAMVDFVRSGIRWADGMRRILDRYRPDVVVMLNGIFLPERLTAELAAERGARLVFFERGRDAGSVFLSHELAAPKYDISDAWDDASLETLLPHEDQAVTEMVSRRARGEKVIETYWAPGEIEEVPIADVLRIADATKVAVLYTNVIWDTAMQDRDIVFPDMFAWIERAVDLFATRPDWTLVIRVHPAETQLEGRESHDRVAEWISKKYPQLPKNLRIVPPAQPVDSYALMRLARIGLVYASTAGLELALHNVPVIVAGDAHYRAKGFTYDPVSVDAFDNTVANLLDRPPSGNGESVTLARKYAHLFFLRRTFPASVVAEPRYAQGRLAYSALEQLNPGKNHTLDVICDGILTGSEFVI